MKKASPSKPSKQSKTDKVFISLLIALVVQFGLLSFVVMRQSDLRDQVSELSGTVSTQQAVLQAATIAAIQTHVSVSAPNNAVYIPELRIKLPLTPRSTLLTYSLRSLDKARDTAANEADISTVALASYPLPTQEIGCSSAVRVKLEDKANPYNPHETVTASVKLADGRTLQVYAFHHDDCKLAFQVAGVDADAMAGEFRGAESY